MNNGNSLIALPAYVNNVRPVHDFILERYEQMCRETTTSSETFIQFDGLTIKIT